MDRFRFQTLKMRQVHARGGVGIVGHSLSLFSIFATDVGPSIPSPLNLREAGHVIKRDDFILNAAAFAGAP
ncbi:hypothetical protein ACFB49_02840 [Sphingomonas sp. DBB INV C78]